MNVHVFNVPIKRECGEQQPTEWAWALKCGGGGVEYKAGPAYNDYAWKYPTPNEAPTS